MNNQQPHNQGDTKEAGVEKRRRFIKGAGIAAPVILTLSSPSVFGALCLSEIMSGNASGPSNSSCTLGQNPTYWKNPTAPVKSAWTAAGLIYGSRGSTVCTGYSGGSTFFGVFGVLPTVGTSSTTMLSIICSATTNTTLDAYLVAAMLNAKTPNSGYLYTPAQVIQLKKKTLGVPPLNSTADADVLAFLKTTMTP